MLDGLTASWHWSPFSLLFLLLLCLIYGVGISVTRKRANSRLEPYRVPAFTGAILLIAIVLFSPLDMVARTQLFAAHMIQVVILATLCAPLLLASCPEWLLLPPVRQPVLGHIFRFFTHPVIASILFNAIFLIWSAPVLYNFALQQGTLYHIELLSLLVAALLNWWPLIGPLRGIQHLSYPQQMLYAFLDGQPVDVFAFLLVFTGVVFYSHYTMPQWFINIGGSAIADQTIAGAFLLIPGLIDLVVMSPLFFRWLSQMEAGAKLADLRRQEELEAALLEEGEEMQNSDAGLTEA